MEYLENQFMRVPFKEVYTLAKKFLSRYHPDVYHSIHCDDVVQEVVINTWRNFEGIAPVNFKGYVRICVRNTCINLAAKAQQRQEYELFVDMEKSGTCYIEDFDEQWEVDQHLAGLSCPQQQKAIALKIAGYKDEEGAEWMNIPSGTYKTAIHKARTRLVEITAASGLAARYRIKAIRERVRKGRAKGRPHEFKERKRQVKFKLKQQAS
jgi:RNA polymerase sigma factor (sigma-70 family)